MLNWNFPLQEICEKNIGVKIDMAVLHGTSYTNDKLSTMFSILPGLVNGKTKEEEAVETGLSSLLRDLWPVFAS